jgi:hypothetical protein
MHADTFREGGDMHKSIGQRNVIDLDPTETTGMIELDYLAGVSSKAIASLVGYAETFF